MNERVFNSLLRTYFGKTLVSCLTICQLMLMPVLVVAAPKSQPIPKGWESYLSRPDILEVEPKESKGLPGDWKEIKNAQLAFVAELLEMYPKDTQIYFLARDSEHLYDIARLATQGTPEQKRIRLLNVSRLTTTDANLVKYLEDNGITEKSLADGQKVLFVDTGFAGSIPNAIKQRFSATARANIRAHLIVSNHGNGYPSSRAFLVHLSSNARYIPPHQMHNTIVNYEHIPRFTDRASRYELANGHYHPMSPVNGAGDGTVSKSQALKQMQDIAAYWQKDSTKKQYQSLRKEIRDLIKVASGAKASAALNALASQLKGASDEKLSLAEAILRDVFDSADNADIKLKIDRSDVGLIGIGGFREALKKAVVISENPILQKIYDNPEKGLKSLIASNDVKSFQLVLSGELDSTYADKAKAVLFEKVQEGPLLELQKNMLSQLDSKALEKANEEIFAKKPLSQTKDLLEAVLKAGGETEVKNVAEKIMEGSLSVKEKVAQIEYIIKNLSKKNKGTLQDIAEYVAKEPEIVPFKETLKLLLELGDASVAKVIAENAFTEEDAFKIKDLLPLAAKELGVNDRFSLLKSAHANLKESAEYIKIVESVVTEAIKIDDKYYSRAILLNLLANEPAVANLYKMFIENSSATALRYARDYTYQPINAEQDILRDALFFDQPKQRKEYLQKKLAEIKSPLVAQSTKAEKLKSEKIQNVSKAEAVKKPKYQEISADLQPNDKVLIEDTPMKVISVAGEGKRGVVFKVQASQSGIFYALKVAKNQEADTLESIQKESNKVQKWKQLGIPHANLLVQGNDFVLKDWVEGERGDKVMERFLSGDASAKKAVESLFKIISEVRSQGAYIGDFRPANVILAESGWVVIDSGSIKTGMSTEEAHARWTEKFERRWKMEFNLPAPNVMKCENVFKKAG